MKKIIAFMLCSTTSCSFGLNMPSSLKPNASSLSQSWNSFSFTSQAMIVAASAISLAAILYAAWPTSEHSAHTKALIKLNAYKKIISDQVKRQKSNPNLIKQVFDETENPTTFIFGSPWNRNAFQVLVGIENNQNILILSKRKILEDEPLYLAKYFYDATGQKWIPDLFNAAMK